MPMEEPLFDFEAQLTVLVATELALANRDPKRLAATISRLADQVSNALAVAFRDDTSELDRIVSGLEGIIHRNAVARVEVFRRLDADDDLG